MTPVSPLVAVPSSRSFREGDVSVGLVFRPDDAAWDVLVTLIRPPDLPQLEAYELTVRLLDAADLSLPVLSEPSGLLVDVGGSLGTTVNVDYRFATPASDESPSWIEVEYRGERASFALVPAEANGQEGPAGGV